MPGRERAANESGSESESESESDGDDVAVAAAAENTPLLGNNASGSSGSGTRPSATITSSRRGGSRRGNNGRRRGYQSNRSTRPRADTFENSGASLTKYFAKV